MRNEDDIERLALENINFLRGWAVNRICGYTPHSDRDSKLIMMDTMYVEGFVKG